MAEAPQNGKPTKANIKKADTDLPPPPPQDSVPDLPPLTGSQDSNPLPLPPPKESFSKFYQQRQVNELKRLYRHMHPELRKNLEEAVTEDLAEMLNPEESTAQASTNLDAVLPGDVQSMRWIFENWTLDSIGDHQASKKLTEEEAIPSGDVKSRSMKFESQSFSGDQLTSPGNAAEKEQTKGDVHTALWLFETQPLDSLNKMYLDETDMQQAVLKEPVQRGDVKGATQLFETHSLETLGRCSSVEEQSILQLKSEIQELKGDVKKTIKLFQTEPLCAIRDKTGNIHEIKSVCREEIQSNAVRTARWLFETQPLDTINKDMSKVQVIRGISLEEVTKGNVSGAKWMFETQPLDAIRELTVEEADFKASPDLIQGADVSKQCLLFETQPLDTLKGEPPNSIPAKEEVLKGDVKSTLWLFETQPMERLKDNFEVGHLQKVELSEEEKGAVKQRKHIFETCPLGSICKAPSEDFSATNIQEVEKGDVKAFKSLFETLPLDSIRQASTEADVKEEEEVPHGNVKANQLLFETTPLYAIRDCFGNFHKVTSVSREEEVTGGDVKKYKWMFETKPLDQFDDSVQKVDIIKGITKQEVVAGDVKTSKWLFETQPIDVIHSQINLAEQNASGKEEVSQGGDVKTCRWLFETHPIDALYEKAEKKQDREEPVPQGDVKSCTWMFETQPLDSLRGQEEQYLQVSETFSQDELQGVDVKTVRHLFETEPLIENASEDISSKKIIRYSSHVEIQSGEVSRVKEFFEAKPLDSTGKPNIDMKEINIPADENIEPGAVHKFTWLFENCPMDTLKSSAEGIPEIPSEKDVPSGDVGGKRFIFETFSLGQIHDKENEIQIKKIQEETMNKASVKSCTMLFETQPLYAIQDRDGGYHEVTSVKKEEIMKGDVKGARWQFETKPLDQIKKDEEVFVIRAVTQEDFKKGDVQAARWRFETEPLDSIAEDKRPVLRTVDDVQRGDVQSNKELFESEQFHQRKYVRMVSVSDVKQGDVRTSTWLFENQPIDSLRGEPESTSSLNTVQREDIHKGDVKRCTWLFETQPMDSLKDPEASASTEPPEVVPQADVKSTTWLFESTPLDKLSMSSEHCTEIEVKERTIKDTLEVLFSHQVIQHDGILIETNSTESVKMVKYQFSSQGAPEIQKEEVMGGNLERILLQLLHRTKVEAQGLLVKEEEDGNIKISPVQLLDPSKAEKSKEDLKDDMAKALQGLLSQDASAKKGIVMQETGTGSVKLTIYSLSHCIAQREELIKGDVKSTIGNLLASSQEQKATTTITRGDNERGNVHLYTTCIEKGDLDYLKNLQRESEIEALVSSQAKEEPPKTLQEVPGPAQLQEEKVVNTTADVTLGGSSGAKEVLSGNSEEITLEREGVHASDLDCPFQCLGQPPSTATEKVVLGNVKLVENCSNRAVREGKILGDGKEGMASTELKTQKDEMDGASHCFHQTAAQPPKQDLGGDLQAAMQSLRLATAEAKSLQHQVQSKLQKTTEDLRLAPKHPQAATPQQAVPMQATGHNEGRAAGKQQHASHITIVRVQETSKSHTNMSQKSTASPTKVVVKDECASCAKPVYTVERLDIQNIPLHRSCFYCKYCRRTLSLLNYRILHGAFYCQVHYKLLAEGESQEETTSIKQQCRQLQTAAPPNPGLEPKTQNNQIRKILMREKMQPRVCRLHPEDGLRSPGQTRQFASQNKLRISWPPSKEKATPEDAGRKLSNFGTSKKLLQDSPLFQQSKPDRFIHKALGHKSTPEASQTEKTQRLLPRVAFPNRRDRVSCWFKQEGGSEDLEIVEKRLSSMDRKIPGAQTRKPEPGISEKAKIFQNNMPKLKRSLPTVPPLTSSPAKPSTGGSSPFYMKAFQTSKAAHGPEGTVVPRDGYNLEQVSSEGYHPSGCGSSKEASDKGNKEQPLNKTEPLPKARIKLPVLTKLDHRENRKAPETNKSNMLNTLVLEESKRFSHINPELKHEMGDHKPSQTKTESSVYPIKHKDEKSSRTKDQIDWTSASHPDSLEMHEASNQVRGHSQMGGNKAPGNTGQTPHSASLQPYPETHREEVEKNEMNPERKPGHLDTLSRTPEQTSQGTKLEAPTSVVEDVAEEKEENRNFSPSSDLQDSTLTYNLSSNDNPEPIKAPNVNADLQASSENAFHLQSPGDTVGGTVIPISQLKMAETFSSCEAPDWTENQATEKASVNVKPPNKDGSTLQATRGKSIIDDSARMLPPKKERNSFGRVLVSKNQGSASKKEPAGTRNVNTKQSALVTLFGCSSDIDKNKKEQSRKTIPEPLVVRSDEKLLQVECFSNSSDTEETSQGNIHSRNSEGNLLDLKKNYQSLTREEQRESSPLLVNSETSKTKTLPAVLDTGILSSAAVLPGTTTLEIPTSSDLNEETTLQDDAKPSPFVNVQISLATPEQMRQHCASSLAETPMNVDLHHEQSSNLANLDGQDLELKARHVSFSCSSKDDEEHHLTDRDHQVPDMLLFSVRESKSVSTQGRDHQITCDLVMGSFHMKDTPGSTLSSSDENLLQRNNPLQLSEFGPPADIESLHNEHILGAGNSEMFQQRDFGADDLLGLGPCINQSTVDNYLSGGDNSPPLLPFLQPIPELLQNAIRGQAEERLAAAERYCEDQMAAEEDKELTGSMKLELDITPPTTVI